MGAGSVDESSSISGADADAGAAGTTASQPDERHAPTPTPTPILPPYTSFYSPSQLAALSQQDISIWKEEYTQVSALGCEVVTNAGFFNVSSGACLGDLVSAGSVVQTSDKHNVNFGIRGGQFVTGYVSSEEITGVVSGESEGGTRDGHVPFDTLVSGLGWLVREGEVYVEESFHSRRPPVHPSKEDADSPILSSLYSEDMSAQSSGDSFPTLLSARTALGHDAQGRLLLLQVEGESWVRGMSLSEFAAFAVELGFVSAINLDGGGSATMTVNHSLVSEPSWQCGPEDYTAEAVTGAAPYSSSLSLLPQSALDRTYCEKRVSSVTCIHSMPPPPPSGDTQTQKEPPSTGTATETGTSTESDKKHDEAHPSVPSTPPPNSAPSDEVTVTDDLEEKTSPSETPTPSESRSLPLSSARERELEAELRAMTSSRSMFKLLSLALGVLLVLSLVVHVLLCWRNTHTGVASPSSAAQRAEESFQWHSHNTRGATNGLSAHAGASDLNTDRGTVGGRDVELVSSQQHSPGLSPSSLSSDYPRGYPDHHGRRGGGGGGGAVERDIEQGHGSAHMSTGSVSSQQRDRDRDRDRLPTHLQASLPLSRAAQQKQEEEELALEQYGLPDTLDFNEFDDSSDEDNDDRVSVQFKKPSDMAYINQPVPPPQIEDSVQEKEKEKEEEEEDLDEEEMDIAEEEQTSLLSPPPPPPPADVTAAENSRKKKKKSKDKKSKRMSMDFSDRSL